MMLPLRLLSAMGIMSPLAFGQMLQAPSTHPWRPPLHMRGWKFLCARFGRIALLDRIIALSAEHRALNIAPTALLNLILHSYSTRNNSGVSRGRSGWRWKNLELSACYTFFNLVLNLQNSFPIHACPQPVSGGIVYIKYCVCKIRHLVFTAYFKNR